jgi:hypothetical protein
VNLGDPKTAKAEPVGELCLLEEFAQASFW